MRIFKKFLANLIPTPKTGQVTLFIDSADGKLTRKESNGDLFKYSSDTSSSAGGIPATLNEYDTHAAAIADNTLAIGSFYVLAETNLEGFPSEGQTGPFFRKN